MNRASLAGLPLLAGLALATPNPPPPATWAEWTGRYEGRLGWSGCAVAGAKSVALALELSDGVASIDLAPARPGLGEMSLVAEERGWSAQQGDVKVTLSRPRANTLDLAIELESGCTARGQLARPSTGVAACDTLVGWARVEARCTKLPGGATEPLAKLLATRFKPADAGACTARANRLAHALVDAGCAPHPDPQIGSRARACLDLAQVAARVGRCNSVPRDLKDSVTATATALVSAAHSAEKATLPYVEQQCRDSRALAISIATRFNCP
jgi:hypothetical protein